MPIPAIVITTDIQIPSFPSHNNAGSHIIAMIQSMQNVIKAAEQYAFTFVSRVDISLMKFITSKITTTMDIIIHATLPPSLKKIYGQIAFKDVITIQAITQKMTLRILTKISIVVLFLFVVLINSLFVLLHILYNIYTKCQIWKIYMCKFFFTYSRFYNY